MPLIADPNPSPTLLLNRRALLDTASLSQCFEREQRLRRVGGVLGVRAGGAREAHSAHDAWDVQHFRGKQIDLKDG
jgi:hypothetical protein